MFAGTLTRSAETAATAYSGMIHSTRFDIAIAGCGPAGLAAARQYHR